MFTESVLVLCQIGLKLLQISLCANTSCSECFAHPYSSAYQVGATCPQVKHLNAHGCLQLTLE